MNPGVGRGAWDKRQPPELTAFSFAAVGGQLRQFSLSPTPDSPSRNIHPPQATNRQQRKSGEDQYGDRDRDGQIRMVHPRETTWIESVHQRNRVMTDAEQPDPGHESGEESLPDHDVQEPHKNRLRRHESQEDEERGDGFVIYLGDERLGERELVIDNWS